MLRPTDLKVFDTHWFLWGVGAGEAWWGLGSVGVMLLGCWGRLRGPSDSLGGPSDEEARQEK